MSAPGSPVTALQASAAAPSTPAELVNTAAAAGFRTIGLHVGETPEAEATWSHGAGSAELGSLVAALLAGGVGVLDVGRVLLDAGVMIEDFRERHTRVLDLGGRLGASLVTVHAAGSAADVAPLLRRVVELARPWGLRPVLVPTPDTPVATLNDALAAVAGTPAGVVLVARSTDISPGRLAELVDGAGSALGYVRLAAEDLGSGLAELAAAVPVAVPLAIGAVAPVAVAHLPGRLAALYEATRR